ncbi:MAG: 30S ribosomal protein S6 [Deltaproteobacteria bacterium]|nr:30S ribosomal protein S6 [Deltaproteobacteria bacterium]
MSEVVRKYELLYIHPGNLPSEDVEKVDEILNGTLESQAGELLHREDWGVRALAYPVQKFAEGRYILIRIACPAGCLKEIERRFKINESVIKFLSIRLADDFIQEEIPEPVLETAEGEEGTEKGVEASAETSAEVPQEEVVETVTAEVSSTEDEVAAADDNDSEDDDATADDNDSEAEKPGEE